MKHLFNMVILLVSGLVTFFLSSVPLRAQSVEISELVGKWNTGLLAEPQGMEISQPAAKLLILNKSENIYQFFVERSTGTPDNFQRIDTVLFAPTYEDPGLQMNSIYYYRLRVNYKYQDGEGWYTTNTVRVSTAPVNDVPEAPTGLEAMAVTSSQINLGWDDNSDNESYYVVIRKTGDTQTTIGAFENATDFEDTDLYPDSLYTYSVVAYNYKGFSTASNEVSLKTLPDTGGADLYPAGMDSLTLMVTPLSVSATTTIWLFPLNRLHGIQPWAVERSIGSPDNFQTIDTMEISINSNPYPDQGMELNTTVYYRLRAIGVDGPVYTNTTYASTFPVDAAPDAPANLRVMDVTSNEVLLEWDDNDNEAFYTIHRKKSKVALIDANTPIDKTQFQDKELLPETTYTYYITAYNYKGHSLASNEVTVTTLGLYTLPDSVFAQWLDTNYAGLIENGNQLVISKAAEITSLTLGNTAIKDLDGLQYFSNLEEFTSKSKIQRVPDLSELTFLKVFVAENANLSFTYLLELNDLNVDSLYLKNTAFEIGAEGEYNQITGAFLLNPGATIEMQSTTLKDIHPQSVFQWYKDHQPIEGQTNESFILSDFTREDVGYYSAIVTNPLLPNDSLKIGAVLVAIDNIPDWYPYTVPHTGGAVVDIHWMAYPVTGYLEEGAIEPGDFVGVFYEDESGELQTHSTGIWTGERLSNCTMILGGDVDGVAPKIGFYADEILKYKLWDPIRSATYEIEPEYAPSGEEANIMLSSDYYREFAESIIEKGYTMTFFNDGLFHGAPSSSGEDDPDSFNWSWSVVVNWIGKMDSPVYTLSDTLFARYLNATFEGLIINENQLVLSKAVEITSMDLGWQVLDIKNLDGLQYFTSLEEFKGRAFVNYVPDLSGLSNLHTFVLTETNLSFTYRLQLKELGLDSLNIQNFVFQLNTLGTADKYQVASLIDLGSTVEFENKTLRDIHQQSVFHWYKNNELLVDETNQILSINNFQREDVGDYKLKITNPLSPGDTLISREYLITVNNLPSWWPETMVYQFDINDDHYLLNPRTDYLEESAIEPGDMIGVFYENENGVLQTNTVGIWTGKYLGALGKILVGDTDGISPKTGFEENEPIKFKLWDPILSREFDVTPEYAPVGEEKSIALYSPFYQWMLEVGIESVEDDIVFTNDGLFHPSFIDNFNEGYWNFSVIVNWVGKEVAPWELVEGGTENELVIIPSDVISDIQGKILEEGDYVGFFFEDDSGELLCTDYAMWTGENLVLNPWISNGPPKNGYAEGEVLKMKVWKSDSQEEYIVDTLEFSEDLPFDGSGLFNANDLSKVTYIKVNEVRDPHHIPLYPGWNLISSYQVPEDTRMSEVLKDVSEVIVKNDRGDVVYAPQNGINTGSWDYDQGYQVYVLSEDTISVNGAIVGSGATIDIPLNTYPYFLPYWYESPHPVEQVMSSIDGRFDYVQQIKYDDVEKRFYADNYIPSHIISPAIDQIGQMSAGLAYKVKMNQAAQYVLQELSGGGNPGGKIAQTDRKLQYFSHDIQKSADNVIVVIPEKAYRGVSYLTEGDEIAVLSPSGKIMGAGVFSGSGMAITAWDVEGLTRGNSLSFKLWSSETDEIQDLEVSSETGTAYHPGELIMISEIKIPGSYNQGPNDLRFVVYPNPVRSDLYIQLPFSDGDNKGVARLADLSGRTIFSRDIDPGSGVTQCDIPEIKSGLYILEVQIDRHGEIWKGTQKVIISD